MMSMLHLVPLVESDWYAGQNDIRRYPSYGRKSAVQGGCADSLGCLDEFPGGL